jgi:transposase
MTERAAYWSAHLAAIEREGVTTRAYASREGLSVAALYSWRRALKEPARLPKAKTGGFVAVALPAEMNAELVQAPPCRVRIWDAVTLEFPAMPPAEWVAALCVSLAGTR